MKSDKPVRRRLLKEEIRERLYRRRYLVPNAVTVGNMFCGFLTIMYASTGRFYNGAVAILFAILLDGLDGRMARRLNATSKFGVEFDSFSDLVSFGVAPAVLMYFWAFYPEADRFGLWVAFIFAVCAAGRLARFNIMAENLQSFLGMPSPAAAAIVASIVIYSPVVTQSLWVKIIATVTLVGVGYLMVSRIQFFSIKSVKVSGMRVRTLVALAALIGIIYVDYEIGLLVLTLAYALSGPVGLLKRKKKAPEVAVQRDAPAA